MGPRDSSQGQRRPGQPQNKVEGGASSPTLSPRPYGRGRSCSLPDSSRSPTSSLDSSGAGQNPTDFCPAWRSPAQVPSKRPQGATSQTTGVTAAPHRVMKALGLSGRAKGTSIIITSEAAAAQLPVCLSSGLWLSSKGRNSSTGPEQLLQFFRRKTRKGGLGRGCVFGDRRQRDENTSVLPSSNQGLALISSGRLFHHKVHTGIKTPARQPPPPREAHSTPVGVCRHTLLLPINNSGWLCKPRGKVLVYRPAIGLVAIWGENELGLELHCSQRKGVHLVLSLQLKHDYYTTRPLSHPSSFPKYQAGGKGGLVSEGVSLVFLLLVHRR